MTQVLIKRAYEKPSKADGFRVLVDRVWPRGVSKEKLHIKAWAKEIAPSTELRQWFGHDPERWPEFKQRYERELRSPEVKRIVKGLIEEAHAASAITLVYGAADTEHNQAVVLRGLFERAVTSTARQRTR